MSAGDQYECRLCAVTQEKARRELHEDPRERLGAVETLRQWITQQEWLKAPTNTLYLLAVLRTKKFSQLEARALLERIWTARTKYPSWYRGMQPGSPAHLDYLRKGPTYHILPKRDKEGRTIILGRLSAIDVSGESYDADDFVRYELPAFDALLLDEEAQVNGYVFLMDCSGISMKMISFFGPERLKRNGEVTQKALAARVKAIHYYGVGPVFEAIFALVKPFIGSKMLSRVKMHGNSMVSVYKHIDKSLLPDEYLPDDYTGPRVGSCRQIIELYIQEKLMDPKMRHFVDDLYNGPYGVDLALRARDDTPQESFRKLNVS